jgi:hypothetical protein
LASVAIEAIRIKESDMINALHLLWIIPLSACTGFLWAAVLAVGGKQEKENEKETLK